MATYNYAFFFLYIKVIVVIYPQMVGHLMHDTKVLAYTVYQFGIWQIVKHERNLMTYKQNWNYINNDLPKLEMYLFQLTSFHFIGIRKPL